MNKDLENTLDELGPGYRRFVTQLRAPFAEVRPPVVFHVRLLAASVVLVLAFTAVFLSSTSNLRPPTSTLRPSTSDLQPSSSRPRIYTAAYASDAYALAAILGSQRRDGSWSNDYLTMQNAAALRKSGAEAAIVAYKKAVRYLRSKGLAPLSDEELNRRKAARG